MHLHCCMLTQHRYAPEDRDHQNTVEDDHRHGSAGLERRLQGRHPADPARAWRPSATMRTSRAPLPAQAFNNLQCQLATPLLDLVEAGIKGRERKEVPP
jgi:hypothetical protein